MGFLKYINRNYSIKKQFSVFFILSTVVSLVLSLFLIILSLLLFKDTVSEAVLNFLILFPIMLFCPLIIMLLLSKLFSKGITSSLKELVSASENIKKQNLDFTIDTSYKNEIGEVMRAFENMRTALEKSLKAQWLMEEKKKDMIHSITHDIKTPVTVICGHLELLSNADYNLTQEQKEISLEAINNNASRIKALINELNEIWDLERTDFTLKKTNVLMCKYLEKLKNKFEYICTQNNIDLIINHPFTDQVFYFDDFRVEELIENIISNSIKYTDKGGCIYIECTYNNNYLNFKISDTGTGFRKQDLKNIFDKYYKSNSGSETKDNSGLGLYICKLITEKHHGIIKAYNNKNGGAVVEFSIKTGN